MPSEHILNLAASLLDAADQPTLHARPLLAGRALTIEDGRAVQAQQLHLRQARGEKVIGVKLGLTTAAQRAAAGHSRPSVGFLTDAMIVEGTLSAQQSIRARVEPEIVAVLGRELVGSDYREADIRSAVASFHAGIEVVDPRYAEPEFVLPDALADNSSARAVLWNPSGVAADALTVANVGVRFQVTGHDEILGRGELLMGDPWIVVVEVITDLLADGWTLSKGFAIFTGNLAGHAIEVLPGDRVVASFDTLGEVVLDVVP